MSPLEIAALFAVMAGLAALPSSSVALLIVHAATVGVRSGLAVAAGIVAGDLLFATLAIAGMSALAENLGSLFVVLRYGAAAYLVWLGIGLIRSAAGKLADRSFPVARRFTGGLMAGFLLTLSDVKAILFYASLFPAFIDLTTLDAPDIVLILAITVLAVGGVKASYAVAARRIAVAAGRAPWKAPAQIATGGLMVGAGGYLVARP
jgi:threonine/homoserine/homoserine lactone efflux protein